ncbi:PPOX class F420-dependent oxidoreductase [Streptomyces sp. XD-27]|uniref:PPOX class F420-dependent oxidoreductase n=1 Tax=Streptomyces sp. XD-27 TaxID=3062779 RepID=UPI0026F43B3D|nr:PPOX class F420-dependent oxidoreductase [Streptomyces sp. XD-27]WKX73630.1 PPOX class F420-dependent oxidoreductase [Streptomyces sp. XD-27]
MVPHEIARSAYVSLVTYRRDGTPVPTPVWAVAAGDTLLVWTGADSWKVRRLRNDPRVTVTPCGFRGRAVRGAAAVPATGRVLADPAGVARVHAAMARKYRWRFRMVDRAHKLLFRGRLRHVGIAVTFRPADQPAG